MDFQLLKSAPSQIPILGFSDLCEPQLVFTDAGAALESIISLQINTLPHFPIIPHGAPAGPTILPIMSFLASEIKFSKFSANNRDWSPVCHSTGTAQSRRPGYAGPGSSSTNKAFF